MRRILFALWLVATAFTPPSATACDCPAWTADDVFARSTLLFIGRARSVDDRKQGYEVLTVLEGAAPAGGAYVADFGPDSSNCNAIVREGAIATVAITDRSPRPSICDGSGNLLGHHGQLGRFFELAGATPTRLSGAAVTALLEPALKGGEGDVWFVGAGPVGETLDVAGRAVHVVDAIDGTPAGEVYTAGRVLKRQDLVFVELVGEPVHDAEALMQVEEDGEPSLIFAFWKGGRIRIPEPT